MKVKENNNKTYFSGEEYNTLFYVVIGLAILSGLLLFGLLFVVYLICKMRSTARKAVKKDFNPLYGIDYEGEETENEVTRPNRQASLLCPLF